MTSERTLSRSEKAGAVSILKNVRDHGIRSATDTDEENGIRLACAVILEGLDAIPELPPVSPENLVEGEWYVFNYHTKFIPMIGKAEIHQGKFRLVDSFHSSKWSWANSETDIYGPLKFKLGGAE